MRIILTKSICTEVFCLLLSGDKNVSFLLVGKDLLHMTILSPAFRKKRGDQIALLAPADFQVSLPPYSSYDQVACFGVAYPATLH